MARCKGTTKSGTQCRLEAQPGSDYCHLHEKAGTGDGPKSSRDAETFELEDLVPLIMVGAMAAGFFVLMRTVGRWIPKF
jgi:hypothetical protein